MFYFLPNLVKLNLDYNEITKLSLSTNPNLKKLHNNVEPLRKL